MRAGIPRNWLCDRRTSSLMLTGPLRVKVSELDGIGVRTVLPPERIYRVVNLFGFDILTRPPGFHPVPQHSKVAPCVVSSVSGVDIVVR